MQSVLFVGLPAQVSWALGRDPLTYCTLFPVHLLCRAHAYMHLHVPEMEPATEKVLYAKGRARFHALHVTS